MNSHILGELSNDRLGITFTCRMAAKIQSADSSEEVIPSQRKESISELGCVHTWCASTVPGNDS